MFSDLMLEFHVDGCRRILRRRKENQRRRSRLWRQLICLSWLMSFACRRMWWTCTWNKRLELLSVCGSFYYCLLFKYWKQTSSEQLKWLIVFEKVKGTQHTSINQCTVIQTYFCFNIHNGGGGPKQKFLIQRDRILSIWWILEKVPDSVGLGFGICHIPICGRCKWNIHNDRD